jgi:BASS family bile acid:Na+ symporter
MRTLIGNGTLLAIVVMTAIGLAVGHLLGGPLDEGRPVLALATAARHPAIAAAIAQAAFPDAPLVPAAVLLDLIVVALVSIPYTRWVKRALDDTIAIPSIAFHERRRSTGGATSHTTRERRARPVQRYDRR